MNNITNLSDPVDFLKYLGSLEITHPKNPGLIRMSREEDASLERIQAGVDEVFASFKVASDAESKYEKWLVRGNVTLGAGSLLAGSVSFCSLTPLAPIPLAVFSTALITAFTYSVSRAGLVYTGILPSARGKGSEALAIVMQILKSDFQRSAAKLAHSRIDALGNSAKEEEISKLAINLRERFPLIKQELTRAYLSASEKTEVSTGSQLRHMLCCVCSCTGTPDVGDEVEVHHNGRKVLEIHNMLAPLDAAIEYVELEGDKTNNPENEALINRRLDRIDPALQSKRANAMIGRY